MESIVLEGNGLAASDIMCRKKSVTKFDLGATDV